MRVLIAPDKYKGSLAAPEVARAMAAGVRRVFDEPEIVVCPLADGGEGTVDALLEALGGTRFRRTVEGPLGAPVEAAFGLLDDGRAVVEVAAACGLALLQSGEREPLRASSRGAGELLAAALDEGATGVVVGIGGTASSDGGTGAAAALGWRFLDADGNELVPGGAALARLARIDGSAARPVEIPVEAGYDVVNPLVGERGAARVFGPQKGASEDEVAVLEAGLERLAARIEEDLGLDLAGVAGAGAGGGLGAGVVAFFGGRLRPALAMVMDAAGLDALVAGADLVITGEGRLDDQSLAGKTPVGVADRAVAAGVRCVAVAGEIGLSEDDLRAAGFDAAVSLVATRGREAALARPAAAIEDATARVLGRYR